MGERVCYLPLLGEDGGMPEPTVTVRRAYDRVAGRAGERRVLVDRVWPRGVSKEELGLDLWMRDVAPSDDLRKWFGHRPERWDEFRRRYREELRQPERRSLVDQLVGMARERPLALLHGAKDRAHNQAVVILAEIDDRLA
jgi:uncharacterized protein YeaO (DUF488 family)